MSDVYWDCLEAVQQELQSLPCLDTATFAIRERPIVKDEDTLPLCLICPDCEQWESVRELVMDDEIMIDYRVYVVIVDKNTLDHTSLESKMTRRADVRRALYSTALDDVSTVFDVNYDPSPKGMVLTGLAQSLSVSVQLFIFTSEESRV